MSPFDKAPSYAAHTKKISSHIATHLKPLGFRKRRNGFNRRLENGLVHQISLFSVGAYSIDHGKFYIHAGCYVPESKLYGGRQDDPDWVIDGDCAIRGGFPEKGYLNITAIANNLVLIQPYLERAIEALELASSYEKIINGFDEGIAHFLARPKISESLGALRFETPHPILKACILLSRSEKRSAKETIEWYLEMLKGKESPHLGHIEHVSEWALENGLLVSR